MKIELKFIAVLETEAGWLAEWLAVYPTLYGFIIPKAPDDICT